MRQSFLQLSSFRRSIAVFALVGSALGARATAAAEPVAPAPPIDGWFSPIVNGLETSDRPTTVALLYGRGRELGCSGTLIGCRTVLTAGHCVEEERPADVFVFAQHAGVFAVRAIRIHPDYWWDDADLAVLELATPVTGITPSPFNEVVDPATRLGSTGSIVGFGISAGRAQDAGIKRTGRVQTASCRASSDGELDDRNFVCWRFDRPFGPAGQDSNTCDGDSGGPLFLNLGGREVVAGVTSGGLAADCGDGDVSYDANVFTYRGFVRRSLGRDAVSACGGLPPVGSAATAVRSRSGAIGWGQELRSTLQVGPGARELRVALNGEDDGALEIDLYLRRGNQVSTTAYDCRQAAAGNFAMCRVVAPAAGTWSVMVRSRRGDGRYQLTATAFGATLAATASE
jgi:hypothetical protein